jgi:hypothetical protein
MKRLTRLCLPCFPFVNAFVNIIPSGLPFTSCVKGKAAAGEQGYLAFM